MQITQLLKGIAASVFLGLICPVLAVGNGPTDTHEFDIDAQNQQQFNWILFVDASTLKNYMSYQGSTLNPIDRFLVTYRQTNSQFTLRGVQAPYLPPVKFEEFWYHTGKAIGLRRYNELPVPRTMQGAMLFRATESADVYQHPLSAANCITRLLLEVYLNQSIVAAVLVPDSAFDRIATDLPQFNFSPVKQGLNGNNKGITVRLQSYPTGTSATFYYDDGAH